MQDQKDLSRHENEPNLQGEIVTGRDQAVPLVAHASPRIVNRMQSPTTNNLRTLRQKRHMTMQDVADRLGLQSVNRISLWERGLLYPHVINFLKLLTIYGVSAEEVYGGLQVPTQEPAQLSLR